MPVTTPLLDTVAILELEEVKVTLVEGVALTFKGVFDFRISVKKFAHMGHSRFINTQQYGYAKYAYHILAHLYPCYANLFY